MLQLGVHGPGCAAQDEEVPYCGAGNALAHPALHTSAHVPRVIHLRQTCCAACNHVASSGQIPCMNTLRRVLMSLLVTGDNVPQSQRTCCKGDNIATAVVL